MQLMTRESVSEAPVNEADEQVCDSVSLYQFH